MAYYNVQVGWKPQEKSTIKLFWTFKMNARRWGHCVYPYLCNCGSSRGTKTFSHRVQESEIFIGVIFRWTHKHNWHAGLETFQLAIHFSVIVPLNDSIAGRNVSVDSMQWTMGLVVCRPRVTWHGWQAKYHCGERHSFCVPLIFVSFHFCPLNYQ